ncbi:hypothetical protein ENSA7_21290 [Enhygromyxa salina]|uniref:Uncharacterized protein n=1 Tax=Enhygromyxa salina TaxID=215803 RepID=A0A2S9YSS9_9BACT|nr:hypothetical protein ENSA7_21290 [Enhygromyxa salina]
MDSSGISVLGGNALSLAFSYMSPDNNSGVFAEEFAHFFIVNRNKKAVKR